MGLSGIFPLLRRMRGIAKGADPGLHGGTEDAMTDLRGTLAGMFEVGQHPLTFQGSVPRGGGIHDLSFTTAAGAPVRGILCRPDAPSPLPVVLNLHAHGNRYEIGANELTDGRAALQAPLGPVLMAMGIASVCLDMPCFGARSGAGESAAAKAALWEGRSLAGQMIGESVSALDWIAAQDWVDPSRIGVFGMSMGATLGYWLAAVDGRVRALVQVCCLADFRGLIAAGGHDLHGIYLTVPGLLRVAGNGEIAGLVAPRAQLICIGDLDPLTPEAAVEVALRAVRAGYARGGRLVVHREALSGHVETAAMRAAALAFLRDELIRSG